MIPRYDNPEISVIWSDHGKFSAYLEVELALLKVLDGSFVPAGTWNLFNGKVKIKPERIVEIEATTKHDVIAFCTSITEQLPDEVGQYFHYGVTSSDIIDTATTLQIKKSLEVIIPNLKTLLNSLKEKAIEHKETLTMGRSHGMNAEPTSFGLKFLSSYNEFNRRLDDLQAFAKNHLTGQISGAVGNYTILNTDIEKKVLGQLGLNTEKVSTQVIPRDQIAKLLTIGGLIAGP